MSLTIPGFRYERVPVADGVALNTAIGGRGAPVVLLHGFPQTMAEEAPGQVVAWLRDLLRR